MVNLNIDFMNEYENWNIDKDFLISTTQKIFDFYMNCPEIVQNCCLKDYEYNSVSFDFLFCNNEKTHVINREYRQKDYPADIITFAVFADSDDSERFVLEFEINLGEIIISLEKMEENAKEKNIDKKSELAFFVSHGILHLLGFDHQNEEEFEFVVSHQKKALEYINIDYDKI